MKKLFLFLPILASGCTSLYLPNTPNTPMLTNKGELHASGNISYKGNFSFNTAYAVANNLAVMANGSTINYTGSKKDFDQKLFEGGIGYFSPSGINNSRVFELYGGIGNGKSNRIIKEKDATGNISYDTYHTTFNKLFVQANYGSKNKSSLNLFGNKMPLTYGTALRFSYVTMNKFLINNIGQTIEDNFFIEPVFFTHLGLSKAVQLQYTSGSNFGLINNKFLTAGNSVLTVGIAVNFGGKIE